MPRRTAPSDAPLRGRLPVKEHSQGREILLYRRLGMRALQRLNTSRNLNR
jgi:hypothetical protein